MISLRKHGNGRSSTLACVCADGMIRVNSFWDTSLILAVKYFLLGNPFNVWSSTAGIAVFAIVGLIYILRWQRHYVDFTPAYLDHIHYAGLYPLIGWGLHYAPFFIMGRYTLYFLQNLMIFSVLYVHHYLPALYFAILTEGFLFDHFTRNLTPKTRWIVFGIAYIFVVATFIHFRAISFGMEGDNKKWQHLNWLPKWRIADRD
jgi:dolichyl-phosphate-mannose-protein mannosyltransferase